MLKCACVRLCRYQKFSIAEDIDLVVRCELDGVISIKDQDQLLSIKALNEFDSKTTGEHLSPDEQFLAMMIIIRDDNHLLPIKAFEHLTFKP